MSMKEVQNKRHTLIPRSRIAHATLLVVCLSCVIAFFMSPFSPIHADSSAPAWNGNYVSYNVGDVVSYNGNTYVCTTAHTSEPNWDPADSTDLWQPQTSGAPVTNPTPAPPAPAPPAAPPAAAAAPPSGMTSVAVTIYTDIGYMADGNQTYQGACSVWTPQFPFGTTFNLYYPNDLSQVVFSCTAEDTGVHICQNDVDVALPGQVQEAIQFGVQTMELQTTGFNQTVANEAAANHATSQGCEGGSTH